MKNAFPFQLLCSKILFPDAWQNSIPPEAGMAHGQKDILASIIRLDIYYSKIPLSTSSRYTKSIAREQEIRKR